MTEAIIANVALVIRVLLLGGILLVLPRITRKGLMFGAYVGETFAEGESAHELRRGWDRGCLAVMALALVVGLSISAAGWPVPGNFTGTAVLLIAALVLYVRTYHKARALAPPSAALQATRATASLTVDQPRGRGLAWLSLVVCVLVGLATIVHAVVAYAAMPDQVPTLQGLFAEHEERVPKSLVAFLIVPGLNLVVGAIVALNAVLVAGAKRSVRAGSGGRSAQAQAAFQLTMVRCLAGMALLWCLWSTVLSVQAVRVCLGRTKTIGTAIWWITGALILFGLATLVRILFLRGQGGALLEQASGEAPLTGGLADDAHWILGMFYVDKGDPSILVEKRFGIGYTLNYGNWKALLFLVSGLVAVLGLLTLAVIELLR